MTATFLGDAPGPRGRRRVLVASIAASVLLGFGLWVALRRLAAAGQLDAERWELLTDPDVIRYLLRGLRNTLTVAGMGMVLAGTLGGMLALGRISRSPAVRFVARSYVEFFRGFPLILLVFFAFYGLSVTGIQLSRYWSLVFALSAYNGAVMGEIFRAGILSLDRGQREAAMSLGMRYWPMMRIVILPQALRRMIPTIVSQAIVLLKDSSLGFVVGYEELLRSGQLAGTFGNNQLQTLTVVAVIFLAVNFVLSRIARRLEVRQRRRYRAESIEVSGVEDLVAVNAPAAAGRAR